MSSQRRTAHRTAHRLILVLLALLLTVSAAHAQSLTPIPIPDDPPPLPDYRITVDAARASTDGRALEITFTVRNQGGAIPESATGTIRLDVVAVDGSAQPSALSSTDLAPIAPDASTTLVMSARLADFTPGTRQVFQIRMVASGIQGSFTDSAPIAFDIPTPVDTAPSGGSVLNILGFTLDLGDPTQLALLVGIGGAVLIILWLLLTMLRLLFSRPPSFGRYAPPYPTMPHVDPHSTEGIRQGWQAVAQNNLITAPCSAASPNSAHACKHLVSADGLYLTGWRVTAGRMTLYDQYGRISRTQTPLSASVVKRLSRVAQQREKLTVSRARRRLKPVARQMARAIGKSIDARTAPLPIALDLRLSGRVDQVGVLFELYQCRTNEAGAGWMLIDRWQPALIAASRSVHESCTYTVFGLRGGETLRAYKRRLADEISEALLAFIAPLPDPLPQQAPVSAPEPAAPNLGTPNLGTPNPESTPPPAAHTPRHTPTVADGATYDDLGQTGGTARVQAAPELPPRDDSDLEPDPPPPTY